MEIRCRYSTIAPFGGEFLQATTDKRRIGAQLRKLPCMLHATGADEVVIRFHVDDIEKVLAVLNPYRRRQVSEARRERLAAKGSSLDSVAVTGYSALGAANGTRKGYG